MSKFTVMYKSTNSMYLNVEADSLEEAKETAENTDGGEFINAGCRITGNENKFRNVGDSIKRSRNHERIQN